MRLIVYFWKRLQSVGAVYELFLHMPLPGWLVAFLKGLHFRWKQLPLDTRGVCIGIAIALGMHVFHDLDSIRKLEDSGLDWMIKMNRGVPRMATSQLPPMTFIDIDERSYRHWGEPLTVPRDKLLSLIRYAVEGGASIIMVDVELSRLISPDDQALSAYLSGFHLASSAPPEILLARGLRYPLKGGSLFEQRPSFLDSVVLSNPHLHWAAPLYSLDDDGVIRHWRLWESTCYTEPVKGVRQVLALPSFQLLAATLLAGHEAASTLSTTLQAYLPASCDPVSDWKAHEEGALVSVGNLRFHARQEHLGQRILYGLPWHLKAAESYPIRQGWSESNHPVFTIKPAVTITEVAQLEAHSDLQGQVVVIGASYADSRDIYATPLSAMPGSMVIANSFFSFSYKGELEEYPWLKWLTEIVLIVLVAKVFAHLPGLAAKLVASALTLVLLLPISFLLFRSGVWLDFAIPLAAVEMHAMIGGIEKKLDQLND